MLMHDYLFNHFEMPSKEVLSPTLFSVCSHALHSLAQHIDFLIQENVPRSDCYRCGRSRDFSGNAFCVSAVHKQIYDLTEIVDG